MIQIFLYTLFLSAHTVVHLLAIWNLRIMEMFNHKWIEREIVIYVEICKLRFIKGDQLSVSSYELWKNIYIYIYNIYIL